MATFGDGLPALDERPGWMRHGLKSTEYSQIVG